MMYTHNTDYLMYMRKDILCIKQTANQTRELSVRIGTTHRQREQTTHLFGVASCMTYTDKTKQATWRTHKTKQAT